MANLSVLSPCLLLVFYVSASFCFSSPTADQPETFIIHTSSSDKPTLFTSHHDWYKSILTSLPPSPHPTEILYTYNYAITGFSARLTPSQASILSRIPGVISVVPEQIRQLQTTRTPHFLDLSPAYGLWPSGAYGDDVIIGVLDTGIWPEHPSFSDVGLNSVPDNWNGACEISSEFPAGSCNKKLIGARALYRGYVASQGKDFALSKDSLSPRDTQGHGTHCASTAAGTIVQNASFYEYARGQARGMASKARIAAYKICWSRGCAESDILAAMDKAIEDGVHILSLSIGGGSYATQYDDDLVAIGAFGATQRGIIVSCAAGNTGPRPLTVVNVAPWILTVGASSIDREFPADVLLGDNTVLSGVSLYPGEPLNESMLPLVYAGDAGSKYCSAGDLSPSKVKGKIVVCDRGVVARVKKGSAVKLAGGVAMVLANTPGSGEGVSADPHLIPATMVGETAGDKIRKYIKSTRNPTATIVFRGTVVGNSPSAPRVGAFSGRGPNRVTPEILKPDLIAPGVNILAGWTGAAGPTDLDSDPRRVEFNIISGTSMACPHVSGLAALLRKAHPKWSPAAIKSALMTTAYNLDNSENNIIDLNTDKESTPFIHGAGHVDPNSALDPGLVYDLDTRDYIAFLCSIGYNARRISIIVREDISSDVCDGNLSSPGDLNYPSFGVVLKENSGKITYKRAVKNVGSSVDAVYEVKVSAPENVNVTVSPSKLVFSAEHVGLSYEITFATLPHFWPSNPHSFGSIEWSDGTHSVRSPIAVTWKRYGELTATI